MNTKRPADDELVDWRTPKRYATINSQEKFDRSRNLSTQNQFQSLPVDNDVDTGCKFFNEATTAAKKSGHIPPIILELNTNLTHEKLKSIVGRYSNRFHLQYRNGNKVAVICYTTDSHQAIKQGLRNDDIAFITYTRKDEKTPKVVIKGLPSCFEKDLPSELDKLGFKSSSVTVLTSRKESTMPCPPYLVQLAAGVDLIKFRQIKYLFNCVISIHKFQPNSTAGTQCFRCQKFRHSSKNCNMPARCVKCTEPHATSECSKKDRKEPARCCNCEENHPANYSKCSARIDYLGRLMQKRDENAKLKTRIMLPSFRKVDSLKSYANVAAHDTRHSDTTSVAPKIPPPYKAPNIGNSGPPSEDTATTEMLNILLTIRRIKTEFIACTSPLEKVMLVLTHLGRYV